MTRYLCVVFVLASACVQEEEAADIGESSAALWNGTATNQRPEVGTYGGCTATLIAPRYVLTAAHCTGPTPDGTQFVFTDATGVERRYSVERIRELGRDWMGSLLWGSLVLTDDVSLIRLTSDVPSWQATPAAVSPNGPNAGQRVTIFGFGCGGNVPESWGIKQFVSFAFGTSSTLCPGDSGGPDVFGEVWERGAIWGVNTGMLPGGTDIFGFAAFYKRHFEDLMRRWDGELEQGMDRPGADYAIDWRATAQACADSCRADGRCRAFSWKQGWCYRKDAVPEAIPVGIAVSGLPPAMEPATDRGGQDYAVFTPPEPRAELCAAACGRDPQCRAWTYVQNGGCWLKSGVPAATPCSFCTSGVADRAIEPGYDRNGGDLHAVTASSARACGDACIRNDRCRAWTWLAGSANNCWLKEGTASPRFVGAQYASVVASGVRRGIDVDVARNGGDYRFFQTGGVSPYECQAACARESQCKAWMYFDPLYDGGPATCALKDSIPVAQPGRGVVSGVKGLDFAP